MPALNDAAAIYLGDTPVDRVYMGDMLVWGVPVTPPDDGMPFTAGIGRLDLLSPGATIDWGDGSTPQAAGAGVLSHTYSGAGPWQGMVRMDPAATGEIYLAGPALLSIDAWPELLPERLALSHWSQPSTNLAYVPPTTPPGVRNLSGMFRQTTVFNADITAWRIDSPTDLSNMFFQATAFNQDLSGWVFPNVYGEPYQFSTGATAWVLPKPTWGGDLP